MAAVKETFFVWPKNRVTAKTFFSNFPGPVSGNSVPFFTKKTPLEWISWKKKNERNLTLISVSVTLVEKGVVTLHF